MSDFPRIRHGNHHLLGDNEGYLYNSWCSECYSLDAHIHECFEFVYITEGSCIYTIEGREFVVSAGDLIFTVPNEIHSFSFPKKCMFKRHFLHVYPNFIADFPEAIGELLNFNTQHKNLIQAYLVEQHGLDKYFCDLRKYSNVSNPETYMMAKSCTFGIISKILHILRTQNSTSEITFSNTHINKIINYIHSHSTNAITLNEISENIHLSSVYISRLFKKETGMTLTEYLNMYRIVNAKNLILSGEKITILPEKCGFENYSTFYRAFVQYTGTSPEKFRNTAKAQQG